MVAVNHQCQLPTVMHKTAAKYRVETGEIDTESH